MQKSIGHFPMPQSIKAFNSLFWGIRSWTTLMNVCLDTFSFLVLFFLVKYLKRDDL